MEEAESCFLKLVQQRDFIDLYNSLESMDVNDDNYLTKE